eukprot:403355769
MPTFNFAIVGSIFEVGEFIYQRQYPYKVGLLYQSDLSSQNSLYSGPNPSLTIPIQRISWGSEFEYTRVQSTNQSISIELNNLVDLSIGLGSGAVFDFYQFAKSQTVNQPLIQYEINSLVKKNCVPQNSLTYTPYFQWNQTNLSMDPKAIRYDSSNNTFLVQTLNGNHAGTFVLIINATYGNMTLRSFFIQQIEDQCLRAIVTEPSNFVSEIKYYIGYNQTITYVFDDFLKSNLNYTNKQPYTGSVFKIVDNNEFLIFSNDPNDSGILTLMLWATNGYASMLSYITYSLAPVDCSLLVMDTSQTVIPEFNYTIFDDEQTQQFQPFVLSLPECGPIIYKIENITQVTGKTVAIYVSQNVELLFQIQTMELSALDKNGNVVDVSSFIQVSSNTKLQIYTTNTQHYEGSPYTLRLNLYMNHYESQHNETDFTVNIALNCSLDVIYPPQTVVNVNYQATDSLLTIPIIGSYTNLFTGYCTLPSTFSIKNLDGTTVNTNIFQINSGTGELSVFTNDITLSGAYTLVLKAQNSLGIFTTHQVVVLITNPCIVGNSLFNTMDLTTITYDMRSGTLDTSIGWSQTNSKCPLPITYSVINIGTGLTFSDCQIYSSNILRTIITSYAYVGTNNLAIVVKVGSYQQQQDNFILEVTNTCYTNPQISVPASQLVEYTIESTKITAQILGWSITPSYCGPFQFTMTEANSKSLANIQFNRSTGTGNCNQSMLINDSFPFFYYFGVCYFSQAASPNN